MTALFLYVLTGLGTSSNFMLADKLQRAVLLHRNGQLALAQALYEDILRVQPRHFDALHLLGVVAAAMGDPRKAVVLIEQAIRIAPASAVAYNNRGVALEELGEWDAALLSYGRACELQSDYADPWYNRGNCLRRGRRWEEALASYDQAIALNANYADAYCNRGITLAEMNQPEAALASYDRALTILPGHVEAHYNRGNLLCRLRQWEQAVASYDAAIAFAHEHADARANRAFALVELDRVEEALESCDRALASSPSCIEAHCNRAGALLLLGRFDEALESYGKAIAIQPDHASAHVNRGLVHLRMGQFQQGWADYEWRWQDVHGWVIKEKRNFVQPQWKGELPVAGKSILLHSEQGYGDTIQFCRYAEQVSDLGARVILEVPRALSSLLASLRGVAQIVTHGDPLPPFDFYCPLLSLPFAFRTTVSSIPAAVPYLAVSEARARHWRTKLGERGRLRVGIVWSGGFRANLPELLSANLRRNVPLAALAQISHPDIELYSLQKEPSAASEIAALAAAGGPDIKDYTADIEDFADTAALIQELDLVISVDTSTAHLAGALGKPVWILHRFGGCWRWMVEREDSPWYPTARIYRQEQPWNWDSVLRRVREDLMREIR